MINLQFGEKLVIIIYKIYHALSKDMKNPKNTILLQLNLNCLVSKISLTL
nr:unnamed protein product [Callosobruchus analis]